jgi:hypothetical protein
MARPLALLPATPSAAPAKELYQRAGLWLVLSLLSSLFCVSLLLGVGGGLFCYLALQSASQGSLADAEAKLKWGKIITLSGSLLGVLSTALFLIFR